MEFLKRRLEEVTSNRVDLIQLEEFVESIVTSSSQETKKRALKFLQKWNDTAGAGYMNNFTLAFLTGTWTPTSCNTKESQTQLDFATFVSSQVSQNIFNTQQLSTAVAKSSSSQAKTIPFSAHDLLQNSFWAEFYATFGKVTFNFVFKKCLILFKKEVGFYLVIGTDSCFLYKKLSNTYFFRRAITAGKSNSNCGLAINPYQNRTQNCSGTEVKHSRKRKHSRVKDEIVTAASRKRPKISKDSGTSELVNSRQKKRPISPSAERSIRKKPKTSSDSGISQETVASSCYPPGLIRWIIAKPNWLKTVTEHRDNNINLSERSSGGSNSTKTNDMNELNYIGIFETSQFEILTEGRSSIVLKQNCKIKAPFKKLPKDWKGLHINDCHAKQAFTNVSANPEVILVNVFKISEKFARARGIRVDKKSRCRKKLQPHYPVETDSKTNKPSNSHARQIPTRQCFDPLITLETIGVYYNKTSWTKWPVSHPLSQDNLISSSSTVTSSTRILKEILKSNVGNDSFLLQELLPWTEIPALAKVLESIVIFHSRVKDPYGFIRRILSSTIIKKKNKLIRKTEQKAEWQKALIAPRSTSGPTNLEMDEIILCSGTSSNPIVLSQSSLFPPSTSNSQVQMVPSDLKSKKDAIITIPPKTKWEDKMVLFSKLKERLEPSCILLCLRQFFRLSGIEDLLGRGSNTRGFFKFVKKAFILGGMRTSLHLGQLMALLDPSKVLWLQEINENVEKKTTLLAQVALWSFRSYTCLVMRLCFYITEASDTRYHAAFYLKQVWNSVTEHAKKKYVASRTLQKISKMDCHVPKKDWGAHGINACLRFIPKKNSALRPILCLKKEIPSAKEHLWRIMIMYFVQRFSPHRVRDMSFLRQKWTRFLEDWRKLKKPKLFYVKVDIKDAYPSVKMANLTEILKARAASIGTLIQKEFRVFSSSKIMKKQALYAVSCPDHWDSFILSRPCLVQPIAESTLDATKEVERLVSYFGNKILCIDKQKYSFDCGLPQGWILSENLCNIYYGQMDEIYLSSFLDREGEFLMTSVDDYLFISPDPVRARAFSEKIGTGLTAFHSEINLSKSVSNLWVQSDAPVPSTTCEYVFFCGTKFCLTCGHIDREFSNYAGQDMASSITFNMKNVTSPERFLRTRLKSMLATKLHGVFLDPAINCREKIATTVFKAALLLAFRFYAICRVIFPTLTVLKDPQRAYQVLSAIQSSISCLYGAVSRISIQTYSSTSYRVRCGETGGTMCKCLESCREVVNEAAFATATGETKYEDLLKTELTKDEVFILAYHAFILKIQRHPEPFHNVIIPRLIILKKRCMAIMKPEQLQFMKLVMGRYQKSMPLEFQKVKI